MRTDFRVYVNGKPYGYLNDQDTAPEIVTVPEVPLIPDWPCYHCQTDVAGLMGQRRTYQVNVHHADSSFMFRRFCSARCMAEWLAGELAQEESKP